MITKDDISTRVREYIVKESFSPKETVQNDTLIFENSLLDSMGFLFLIDFLKEEFKIAVEDSDLIDDNFRSINNISDFLLTKLAAKK
jgi:acyl carrier protein